MKLLNQIGRINLLISAVILCVAAVALFFVIRLVFTKEIDEQLQGRGNQVRLALQEGRIPKDTFAQIDSINATGNSISRFADTTIFNPVAGEQEVYRQYVFTTAINNQHYRIAVMTSRLEWEDLFFTILVIFISTAFLMILGTMVANTLAVKRIWNAFFENLKSIKQFSVKDSTPLPLQPSSVSEFQELNSVLTDLTERIRNDYKVLREFTENASHEIQTPLAILQSKLDRLRQLRDPDKEMVEQIAVMDDAVQRLSRLNKDLLLLAKLENHQINVTGSVDFSSLLGSHLSAVEDLFETKEIRIVRDIQQQVLVTGDATYCGILISNLLSNALKYTPAGGVMEVRLTAQVFGVSNTGTPLDFPHEEIFDRFRKGGSHTDSYGLGLAIVKEIALQHQWDLSYAYHDGRHIFSVHFRIA